MVESAGAGRGHHRAARARLGARDLPAGLAVAVTDGVPPYVGVLNRAGVVGPDE